MRFGTLSRGRPWVSAPGMRPVRSFALWEPVGLSVRGVPTSKASDELARSVGIPIVTLAEAGKIDVDIDGADAVDPRLNMIKGYGGALVREKIVAASSRRFVVLVGYEKIVKRLGERGPLPVEVIPFGLSLVTAKIKAMGMKPQRSRKRRSAVHHGQREPDPRLRGEEDYESGAARSRVARDSRRGRHRLVRRDGERGAGGGRVGQDSHAQALARQRKAVWQVEFAC